MWPLPNGRLSLLSLWLYADSKLYIHPVLVYETLLTFHL